MLFIVFYVSYFVLCCMVPIVWYGIAWDSIALYGTVFCTAFYVLYSVSSV